MSICQKPTPQVSMYSSLPNEDTKKTSTFKNVYVTTYTYFEKINQPNYITKDSTLTYFY